MEVAKSEGKDRSRQRPGKEIDLNAGASKDFGAVSSESLGSMSRISSDHYRRKATILHVASDASCGSRDHCSIHLRWTWPHSPAKSCGAEFEESVEALLDASEVIGREHCRELCRRLRIRVICDPGLDLTPKSGVNRITHVGNLASRHSFPMSVGESRFSVRKANIFPGGGMTQSLFRRAQGLIELLAQDPLRAHVMTYLSRELGSTGDGTAVAFLQLSRDGTLHVVSHEGFAHFDPGKISRLAIDSDRAASETLRGGRLRIFTLDQLRTQRSELPSDLREMWSSSVAIPIGLQSLYFLNFREDVTSIPEFESFIQLIASLLTSFELQLREKSDGKTDLWYDEKQRLLSSREERVLTLIREGKTNAQIAFELGYSESLIRQETVSIYRKLGVNGRKDLKSTDSVRKRGMRPLVQTAIALSGIELLGPIINTLSDITVLGG
ncbi:unannotated protein [freshwater metagenome]|uniref:Unannotated protein n=1 Tax=freshwater metagenome TaxID=449393 RepID=A0A6J6DZI1_9ZZZZ